MNDAHSQDACWSAYLSPWKLALLAINGVCFGGLLVLLVVGSASGATVLLTVSTGLSFLCLTVGAIIASRRRVRVADPLP